MTPSKVDLELEVFACLADTKYSPGSEDLVAHEVTFFE